MPPLADFCVSKETAARSLPTAGSSKLCPIKRFIWYMVFLGFVTAWRLARRPTSRSPVFDIATMEGVVRAPSAFSKIVGSPPLTTAIAELVVPRSIPRIFDIERFELAFIEEKILIQPARDARPASLCGTRSVLCVRRNSAHRQCRRHPEPLREPWRRTSLLLFRSVLSRA